MARTSFPHELCTRPRMAIISPEPAPKMASRLVSLAIELWPSEWANPTAGRIPCGNRRTLKLEGSKVADYRTSVGPRSCRKWFCGFSRYQNDVELIGLLSFLLVWIDEFILPDGDPNRLHWKCVWLIVKYMHIITRNLCHKRTAVLGKWIEFII